MDFTSLFGFCGAVGTLQGMSVKRCQMCMVTCVHHSSPNGTQQHACQKQMRNYLPTTCLTNVYTPHIRLRSWDLPYIRMFLLAESVFLTNLLVTACSVIHVLLKSWGPSPSCVWLSCSVAEEVLGYCMLTNPSTAHTAHDLACQPYICWLVC